MGSAETPVKLATGDESNAYASKVLGEKQRLKQSVERVHPRGRA